MFSVLSVLLGRRLYVFRKFRPDFTFNSYNEVTAQFLRENGINVLLIDIDNTLAPYEQEISDEAHAEWFDKLRKAGIRVALISNNKRERVERFNRSLKLPAYPESGKPRRKYMRAALAELNADVSESAILGDQLFTDAYAGKRLGMRAIIVPPIRDKKTPFFRVKRALERGIMRGHGKRKRNKN